jgi:hypothetical protein
LNGKPFILISSAGTVNIADFERFQCKTILKKNKVSNGLFNVFNLKRQVFLFHYYSMGKSENIRQIASGFIDVELIALSRKWFIG